MMVIEIKVPGTEADEVEITEILVEVGGKVEAKQSLITVEGDKVSMEVPSPQADIVKEVKVSVGGRIQTGTLIMIFDSIDGVADAAPAQAREKKEAVPAAAPVAATAEDVNVSDIDNDEIEMTETLTKAGDKAEAEQSLVIVKGDKASMEVPTLFAGIAKEIRVSVGGKISTGSLIMIFEITDEAGVVAPAAKREAAPAATPAPTAGAKEVNIPDIGGDEVKAVGVVMKVSNKATAEQSPTTVEGDKVSMEVSTPFVDVVEELKVNVGDKVEAGSLIMILEVEGAAPTVVPAKQEAAASVPTVEAEAPAAAPAAKAEGKSELAKNDAYVHATPLIRHPARESSVSLAGVKGTGHKGRILHEDVQAHAEEAAKRAEAAPVAIGGDTPGMPPWSKVDFSRFGEIEEVGLGRTRKISGVNLDRSWVMIPYVTHLGKTDITELEAFREQRNEGAAKRKLNVEITPVVFIMKTVAAALRQMSRFSSSLSGDGQYLTLKKYINIGVTVDTPDGLVVPIFKDVDRKGIIKLPRELMIIFKKTRDGKLTVGGMQGGCFIISSIGGLGITHFVLVMNTLEVATFGVSKSAMGPVWNGKEFVPRLMPPISLSFDHRVIDGADDARFITIISNTLSDIRRLTA